MQIEKTVAGVKAQVREWKKEGGIPIKFSLGVEPNEFIVIKKLDEIIDLF